MSRREDGAVSTSGTPSPGASTSVARDPFAPGLPFDAHWPRAGSWLRRETADHADGPLDMALIGKPSMAAAIAAPAAAAESGAAGH